MALSVITGIPLTVIPNASVQSGRTGKCLAERVSFSGSCSMSKIQPITLPNPLNVMYTGIWHSHVGVSVVQRAVAMPCQQHWHHQGCGRCAHQLSKLKLLAGALAPPIKPLKQSCSGGDAVATPKHVLHASTRVEHRSPTQNTAMRCLRGEQ
jgi:hypothetical protein